MRKRAKYTVLVACFLLIGGTIWYFAALRRGIITAYYEWGTTQMICAYSEDNDWQLPKTWDDLVDYEECSKHFNGDFMTIDEAKRHIRIDFQSLKRFQDGDLKELPSNVIKGLRGLRHHWINSSIALKRLITDHIVIDGVWLKKELQSYRERHPEFD